MGRTLVALLVICSCFGAGPRPAAAQPRITLWFPNSWAEKSTAAQKIADELGLRSGLRIVPHIADNNPEILTALTGQEPGMAYVGSMVAAVIWSRRLAQPLFQALDGHHLYAGVMIFPRGRDPREILRDDPEAIAYNIGYTSGEVCAKAASGGRASLGVTSFAASADAVRSGKAKAAFVKDFWWDENKRNFSKLDSAFLPGISESKNPDNVMLVSVLVAPEVRAMILDAAYHSPHLFNANLVVPFDSSSLDHTLSLMKKAGIDPLTYRWPR